MKIVTLELQFNTTGQTDVRFKRRYCNPGFKVVV
jgi:hypothetical protein